ncbi:MAG: metallophosphoesterase [Opitutaceae bacterium]
MATWAIGDIHRQSGVFAVLLKFIPVADGDTVVLLGDLIDRGPDSAGVLQLVHEMRSQHSTVILRGNHEAMLLKARNNRASLPFWIECGGDATLDSYNASSFYDIPQRDWELFESSALYYETAGVIFVHGSLDPDLNMCNQIENDMLWKFYESPVRHMSGKLVVCGHAIQLTFWQVDHLGHRRKDSFLSLDF